MKNDFNILTHIPENPENTKRLIEFKGFQSEVKYDCQESMDIINKADEKPNAHTPPPGPSYPPAGQVTQLERLAKEVNKSTTAWNSASAFESLTDQKQKEVLWKLVESENQYNDLRFAYNRIQNKPTALKFLKMLDSENILN